MGGGPIAHQGTEVQVQVGGPVAATDSHNLDPRGLRRTGTALGGSPCSCLPAGGGGGGQPSAGAGLCQGHWAAGQDRFPGCCGPRSLRRGLPSEHDGRDGSRGGEYQCCVPELSRDAYFPRSIERFCPHALCQLRRQGCCGQGESP